MSLKPWREVAIPHEDVHRGTFVRAEFAADITRVHDGSATPEYQDPVLFFQRTYITEGMGALLTSVAKRLAGNGGDPVIQLQTAFGGGKTHALMTLWHLAKVIGDPTKGTDLLAPAGRPSAVRICGIDAEGAVLKKSFMREAVSTDRIFLSGSEKPVAITVTRISSVIVSSITAPKIISASS